MEPTQQPTQIPLLAPYTGSCHCHSIRFTILCPPCITVWICNCSICSMRKNHHFIIPAKQMVELEGEQQLTTYTFGTHTAKHKFCRKCGITPFYIPRSNPDGYAITFECLEENRPKDVVFREYDGKNWERAHVETGIKKLSEAT